VQDEFVYVLIIARSGLFQNIYRYWI